MSELIYHLQTKRQLDSFIERPMHALLLQGSRGSGKTATSTWLASQILHLPPSKMSDYPYLLIIKPDEKNTISIDTIRQIDHFLAIKVPGTAQGIRRLIIIDDSEAMTLEAQNALLKNLEEPPEDSLFILNCTSASQLLDTVKSRTVQIPLRRPDRQQLTDLLKTYGADDQLIQRAMYISGGVPGLAMAIIKDNEQHPLGKAALLARELVTSSKYGRLLKVNELAKSPQLMNDTFAVLELMAQAALETATAASSKRWQQILTATYQASEYARHNTNAKLNLTHFMLSL